MGPLEKKIGRPWSPACSRSDLPLQDAACKRNYGTAFALLVFRPSLDLALSLFLLAMKASASLPTAHFAALRPPFFTLRARCIQAFLLKPAPFCKLFAGLGRTIKSATFVPFFSQTLALFLLHIPCLCPIIRMPNFLADLAETVFPFLSLYNGSSVTHFFREGTRPMTWPSEVHYCSHSLSNVVSLLPSYPLFSYKARGVLFYQSFSSHRSPEYFSELLVLPRHALCVLCRLHCSRHNLLFNSYL